MSREVHDLLRSTVDEPTRRVDTVEVVERARRQTRLARAGGGLSAIVVLVVVSLVVVPMIGGSDQQPEIADRPGPEVVTDDPAASWSTLGADHVWSGTGAAERVGLAFASEVLGWEDASIIEREVQRQQPTGNEQLVIANDADRTVELALRAPGRSPLGVWEVVEVAAGVEQPVSVTEDASLIWRPNEDATGRHRPFEGTTGVAYVRALEHGTVTIDLDATAVADAEVPLDGHVEFGEPFCHNIQSTLLLFHDDAGEVVSAVGGVWHGQDPPACDTTPAPR